MIQKFSRDQKEDTVKIRMGTTLNLPAETANKIERMGICDQCTYDETTHRIIATVSTTLYRREA